MTLHIHYRVLDKYGCLVEGIKSYKGKRAIPSRKRAHYLLKREPGLAKAYIIKIVLDPKSEKK